MSIKIPDFCPICEDAPPAIGLKYCVYCASNRKEKDAILHKITITIRKVCKSCGEYGSWQCGANTTKELKKMMPWIKDVTIKDCQKCIEGKIENAFLELEGELNDELLDPESLALQIYEHAKSRRKK